MHYITAGYLNLSALWLCHFFTGSHLGIASRHCGISLILLRNAINKWVLPFSKPKMFRFKLWLEKVFAEKKSFCILYKAILISLTSLHLPECNAQSETREDTGVTISLQIATGNVIAVFCILTFSLLYKRQDY
jgi:hypothetical protein